MRSFLYFVFLLFISGSALASGGPKQWQIGFQEAASPVMEKLTDFHNLLLVIITLISLFVLLLLLYVCIRFRKKANPKPSETSHNTALEIIWTTIPVLILVFIAIPSIRSIYFVDKVEKADMTLKVTGYQWYWGYNYPDQDDFYFESYIKRDDSLEPGDLRLLTTDNKVVLPVDTNIRVLVTAADVIHNWAVPAFGIKIDAVPGRLNEAWVRINKTGVYYGQCSELCGSGHGFMPIEIHAVDKEDFVEWAKQAKVEFAR